MTQYPCAGQSCGHYLRTKSRKWSCSGLSANGGEEYQFWQPRKPTGSAERSSTITCPNSNRSKWSQVSAFEI
jgi:hypothetical protein